MLEHVHEAGDGASAQGNQRVVCRRKAGQCTGDGAHLLSRRTRHALARLAAEILAEIMEKRLSRAVFSRDVGSLRGGDVVFHPSFARPSARKERRGVGKHSARLVTGATERQRRWDTAMQKFANRNAKGWHGATENGP